MSKFKLVLHPTDFSPSANDALHIASSLAREHSAKLILLHVAQRPISSVSGLPVPPPPPPVINWDGLKAQLQAMAVGIAKVQVETRLAEGDPAKAIVDTARELGVDIIVVGSHGRTGLNRLLMGSVAEAVVRRANCPVLTIKVPAKQT
jgi:nucleotide-binding universal stress UspA family protein